MQDNKFGIDEAFYEKQKQIYKTSYVTLALVIINVILFTLNNTVMRSLNAKASMDTALVVGNSEYYRLFSSMFMHWDINHLFNNMMVLLLVGAVIEHYLGHLAYLFLYIIAGLSGNLMSMYYEIIKSNYRISLGASGATMGIVGFLVVWLVINRKSLAKDKSMLLRLVLLLMFVVEACFFQAQANTQAHLGGFLAGFIMGMINIIMFNNRKDMEGIV